MIIRIVRMSFVPDEIDSFVKIFEDSMEKIRAFDGCEYLSLHRDCQHTNVYLTVSHWTSPSRLEAYRKSDLFKNTWAKVKPLFEAQPQAFSMKKVVELI